MDKKEELIRSLIRSGHLKTPHIIEAFRALDRADFVPDAFRGDAYINAPIPIGEGQTVSQPLVVAFMLELLQPRPGEMILDVGAGSGWATALLAYCISQKDGNPKSQISNFKEQNKKTERGKVVAIERIPSLAEFGGGNVAKYNFIEKGVVEFLCADATKEEVIAREDDLIYDGILAGAAAWKRIPDVWKRRVRVGGRIVAPVDSSILYIERIAENEYNEKEFYGFSFVPLL